MTAIDPARCPLCGQPNDCVMARLGGSEPDQDKPDGGVCWCANATIPAAVLNRLTPAARGRACICRACVQGGRDGGDAG